jgi:putative ABC transport system permease protein
VENRSINEINHSYRDAGRLAGLALAQASAGTDALPRAAAERPSRRTGPDGPRGEQTVRSIRPALVSRQSVALLLLVAAANALTLLIARASNRRHEFAVRAALGATRARLMSLSIAESLVYAGLGGVAALVLGSWTLRGLVPLFAASLPRAASIDVDARTALFTATLSIVIGILFGAIAAFRPGGPLAQALGASTRSSTSAGGGRSRNALVVAQVALAVVLLSAAGLMLTSVVKLSRVSPGFDADHVLTFKVALTGSRYAAAPARVAFVSDLIERLNATGGVRSAGLTSLVPFGGMRGANGVEIEGRARVAGEAPIVIDQRHVSPGYFQTMKIPLVSGRGLSASDDSRGERVTVINRTMAQRYFANVDPVNHRVKTSAGFDSNVWFRIVGVVDDVRHISLSRDPVPEMYPRLRRPPSRRSPLWCGPRETRPRWRRPHTPPFRPSTRTFLFSTSRR